MCNNTHITHPVKSPWDIFPQKIQLHYRSRREKKKYYYTFRALKISLWLKDILDSNEMERQPLKGRKVSVNEKWNKKNVDKSKCTLRFGIVDMAGWIQVISAETNSRSQWKCQRTRWESRVSQMYVVPAVCVCVCVVFGWRDVTLGLQRFAKDNLGFYDAMFVFSNTHRRIKWKTSEHREHHVEHFWQRRTGWEQHWSKTLMHAEHRGHEGMMMPKTDRHWCIMSIHYETRQSGNFRAWKRQKEKKS